MDALIQKLKNHHLTIACAESMTGGLISSEMTKIPGASKVFKGGIVAYTKTAKINLLNIKDKDIEKYGIVSKEIALEMAKSVKHLTQSTIGIGVTGDAGPTLQKGSEKREAFYALCNEEKCFYEAVEFTYETRVEAQKIVVDLVGKMIIKSID